MQGFSPINSTGSDAFLQKQQQPGDLDVTTAIREAMAKSGFSSQALINYDNNPTIQMSQGKAPATQVFLQKEFWTYQLLVLQQEAKINTLEDRLLLNQFIDPKSWFTYFVNNIMDLALGNNLPTRHGW